MYQGFYDLTSGMLTQQRNLNVLSNNMVNIQTAGYKEDTQHNTTFAEAVLNRVKKYDRDDQTPLASVSPIVTPDEVTTNYAQGSLKVTNNIYDFAISGDGFFEVETEAGVQYTRNGSFTVDDNGTLQLEGMGPVLDSAGNTITLPNEDFSVDDSGTIRDADGAELAQIGLVNFQSTDDLHKEDNGMYTSATDAIPVEDRQQNKVIWKTLEDSNVDMVGQMTKMMSTQRSYQASAQMLKMYDSILSKAATDVGRV